MSLVIFRILRLPCSTSFSPLCLPNRPSINPVTTGKNHIRWIINQLSIEATIVTSSPNCPKDSTTPKENQFLFSFIKTVNPRTEKVGRIFGSRGQIKGNLDNSPNKPGHWTLKKQVVYGLQKSTKDTVKVPMPVPFKQIIFCQNLLISDQPQKHLNFMGKPGFPQKIQRNLNQRIFQHFVKGIH
jgi:hypothetical protein